MVYRLAHDASDCAAISSLWRDLSRWKTTALGSFWLRTLSSIFTLILLCSPIAQSVLGQTPDSTFVPADSSGLKTSVGKPVEFVATDSLILRLTGPFDSASLFGHSAVKMSGSELSAWQIDILFDRDELQATGLKSDSGWVGKPTFKQGKDTFEGSSLGYNMKTGRGRVVGAQTKLSEGLISGDVVKSLEDSVLFIKNGVYTTCDCEERPSYSLRSKKMKLVNKKWIYTGPIQLYLYNIPTPLWLPFGFLPAQDGRRSGPLAPNYGEDEFGFYFRDWGWYFALNEYMDLQLQAGLWTRGSWEANGLFRYRKRYGFDGQLQMSTARFKTGERGDPDFSVRKTGSFRWSHNQIIDPTSTFNANVNLSTSAYLRGISRNYDDRTRQTIQSTLRYSKRWKRQNLSLQLNQNQVLATDEVTLTIPSVSFSQSSFKPFLRTDRAPGITERFYEKLTVSYNMSMTNRFSFRPLSDAELIARGDSAATSISWFDALTSASDFRRASGMSEQFSFQARHRVPISAPFSVRSLPVLGQIQLNLSPSFNYTEDWFLRTDRKSLSSDSTTIDSRSIPGFFALRQFSTSLSASTIFYGLFPFHAGQYSGIRHTVRPNLTYSFRPDFSGSTWGNTRTYTDQNGENIRYSIVSGVSRGQQQQLGFSLSNTFETRKIVADSTRTPPGVRTGSQPTTVKLLDLNLSSNYNFAADSLKFGSILLNARTRLFGKVDVDFRSSFSPYKTSGTGGLIDRSAFGLQAPLGRLTRADLTVRTSLRSSTGDGSRPLTNPRAGFSNPRVDPFNPTASFFQSTLPVDYADFSIPWSMNLDFTYGITRSGLQSIRRAIINTTFDFSLTPNWKVASRTGYDFERHELVTTNLALARDFCCWQLSVNWVPFGDFQSWGFDLHVKSSQLKDLLRLRQPKSDVRDRFGSLR